jgi:hypothetical protein
VELCFTDGDSETVTGVKGGTLRLKTMEAELELNAGGNENTMWKLLLYPT